MTKTKQPRISADGILECSKCGALGSQTHAPEYKGRKKLVKNEGTIIGGTLRSDHEKRNAVRVEGAEVYVVSYDHKHGTDVWVCATEAGAWKSAAEVALEWVCDLDNDKSERKVMALYKKGDYKKCALFYAEATTYNETFSVELRKVGP